MNIDEKLVRMILETNTSNINEIVVMPAVKIVMNKLVNKLQNKKVNGRVYNGTLNGINVSIIRSMIGCPHTAMTIECLKRSNAKIVIRLDLCGGIRSRDIDIDVGNIVIPKLAYCGDGTSPYYIAESSHAYENLSATTHPYPKFHDINTGNQKVYISYPDANLKQIFFEPGSEKKLFNLRECDLWTTDAMFCETHEFIESLKTLQIGAIDMETSILYLLGQLYNLKTLSILSVSDLPGDNKYDMFKTNEIHPELEKGINNAINFLIERLPKVKDLLIK